MQEGINSVGNAVFSSGQNAKSKEDTEAEEMKHLQGEDRCSEDAESCATAESGGIRVSAGSFEIKTKNTKYHTVGARVISKDQETGLTSS